MINNRLTSRSVGDDETDNQKIFLALINVLFGIASTLLAFISLSVVPDCIGQICAQFLTFFVAQVIIHLSLLVVSTVYVAYLLGFKIFI